MEIVTRRRPRTEQDTPAAVALGFFDGVHLGHAAVIGAAGEYAAQNGLRCAVFTFTRSGPGPKGGAIYTNAQKYAAFRSMGVQTCYQPPFEDFCGLSPQDFFHRMLLDEFNAKALFCGQDFAFGAHRAGDAALLAQLCRENGVALQVQPLACWQGQPVSSSRIRQALAAGDLPAVNAMLGRPYDLTAPVAHGKALGGTLGFPTINQGFASDLQTPAHGVYVTRTTAGGKSWPSATGYGTRPTLKDGDAPTCETFIPGFEGDLYGVDVRVEFYEKIADTQKFAGLNELAAAVQGWAAQAKAYFG